MRSRVQNSRSGHDREAGNFDHRETHAGYDPHCRTIRKSHDAEVRCCIQITSYIVAD